MKNESAAFERLIDRYFERLLAENPMQAAAVGLASGRGYLGTATPAFEKRWQDLRKQSLDAWDAISPGELNNEQQLDRLAWRSQLLRECEDYARGRHALDPNALDQVLNILLHELQRGDDEPQAVARHLRSLLKETPRFLTEAVRLIDRPGGVWRKNMEQTAAGSGSLFGAVAAFLKKTGAQTTDGRLIAGAQRAFAKYHRRVMTRPLARAGSFAVGAEILQRRVRDQLGLDYSLGEIESLALGEVDRVKGLMQAACRKFGGNKSPEKIISE